MKKFLLLPDKLDHVSRKLDDLKEDVKEDTRSVNYHEPKGIVASKEA